MSKLTPKELNALLEDLYQSDPSLKSKEKELRALIDLVIKQEPEVRVDQVFMKTLKQKLLEKAKSLQVSSMKNEKVSLAPQKRMFWPVLGMSFGGVAVLVMAVLFVMQDGLMPKVSKTNNADSTVAQKRSALVINRINKQAFGTIDMSVSAQAVGRGGGGGMNAIAQPVAAPMADAYSAETKATSEAANTLAITDPSASAASAPDAKMISSRMIMPPYEQTFIEYEYKGEMLNLKNTMTDVFKRTPGSFSVGNLASAIRGMNIGIANPGTFGGTEVSDISLYQNTKFGYQIYLSPRMGTMSIDQNWEQWQDAMPKCQDEQCWRTSQLKRSDIPSDDELVRLADQFLDEHQIDRTMYGAGEVDKSWEQYAKGADGVEYIPDVVQVIYPLQLSGQTVYVNGGNKVGLNVGVNLRVKRVSSVYNIQQMTFDASQYDPETNFEELLKQAKDGGFASPIRYMQGQEDVKFKTVKAELGTPTEGLIQIYQTRDNMSEELYVPALIFPVTKKAEGDVWTPSDVIVPLVKGIVQDVPQIMPYGGVMMKTEGSGASGSSAGVVTPSKPTTEPAVMRAVEEKAQ